jgi:hypothetical protein
MTLPNLGSVRERTHKDFVKTLLCVLVGIVTIAPPLRLIRILATMGVDTPSSDDGLLIPRFLGKVLDGGYNWLHFPEDTFRNTHSHLVPGLIYIVMAKLGHFNIYWAIYLGVALAAAKLVLLHGAFTARSKNPAGLGTLLMWPILSLLVFSVSQISIFEQDLQALMTGFSQLGMALGIWALVRFPSRWFGALLAILAALIASFSFASGLVLWPVFVVGMAVFGFRKIGQYALLIVSGVAVSASYYYFLYFDRSTIGGASKITRIFDFAFFSETLGRPFVKQLTNIRGTVDSARLLGWLGLVLALVLLAILIAFRKDRRLSDAAPAMLVMVAGILILWQICMTRPVSSPWYTAFALDFWVGLVGLAYVCWDCSVLAGEAVPGTATTALIVGRSCAAAVVLLILVLYVSSNRSWSDKSFFMITRAPVSAATLRNYRTAPTYAEGTLAVWPMGGNASFVREMAQPLERHRLSVFGPHQVWSLQGDSLLQNVDYHEPSQTGEIFWSPDLTDQHEHFTSYRRLNVHIPDDAWLSWTISVPPESERAVFKSAIAISDTPLSKGSPDHVDFAVYTKPQGEKEEQVFSKRLGRSEHRWSTFEIPLNQYRGRMITLRLTATSGTGEARGVYRYPTVVLDKNIGGDPPDPSLPSTPSNTDLYPGFQGLTNTDLRLDLDHPGSWTIEQLKPAPVSASGESVGWVPTGTFPEIRYNQPLSIRVFDYRFFYVKVAASFDLMPRLLTVYCMTAGDTDFGSHHFSIPLLPDAKLHGYTFDLRLAEDLNGAEITGLKITLLEPRAIVATLSPASRIQITDVGFIRKENVPPPDSQRDDARALLIPQLKPSREDSRLER